MAKDDSKGLPGPLPDGFDSFGGAKMGGAGDVPALGTALGIGSAVARVVAGTLRRRELNREAHRQHQAMDDLLADPPPVHGSAAWATNEELRGRGLLRGDSAYGDGTDSILLGAVETPGRASLSEWLHWQGQGHLITVAPTRTGKSTTLIVPNLLRYPGSCVVFDPKGELYDMTSKYRRELGEVYRISPFDRQSDAFNPIESLADESDALALADMMLPEDPRGERFFRNDAIAFLNALIQYVHADFPAERATVGTVRDLFAQPDAALYDTMRAMANHPYRAIANAGQIALGKTPDRGIPNLRDTLNSEMKIWDDAGVRQATRASSFRFEDLKDRVATVYIEVPFNKMKPFWPFLRILFANALDAMLKNRNRPRHDVLFVMDEFLSFGPFDHFRDALRTHAGAGVKLWFFLQDLSTLEQHYPQSWRSFLNAAVKVFFGTQDIYTGEIISTMLGDTTIAQRNTSFSLGASLSQEDFFDTGSSTSLNVSHSVALTGRRLRTAAEIVTTLDATLPDNTRRSVISIAGSKPIDGRLVPYMQGEKAVKRIGRLGR